MSMEPSKWTCDICGDEAEGTGELGDSRPSAWQAIPVLVGTKQALRNMEGIDICDVCISGSHGAVRLDELQAIARTAVIEAIRQKIGTEK